MRKLTWGKRKVQYKKVFVWVTGFLFLQLAAQGQLLKGLVKDEQGQPIAAASLHVLNTLINGTTNSDGSFALEAPGAGVYELELSASGYANNLAQITAGEAGKIITLHALTTHLQNVVVTADKRETGLQQTAGAISAIGQSQIRDLRLWNTSELTAVVPNLFAGNSGDDRNVTSIRGITTTSYDPAVATYVDGVSQFSLDTYIPMLSDIERIEVLRGPQGTLYGRNATGGVINIITRQPTNMTNGYAEISVGNYNRQRYSLGVRTPLVKDKLFLGTSLVFDKRNGYYTNDFNNKRFDDQQQFNGNYYLEYLPAKNWDIKFNLKHQSNKNDGAFPLSVGMEETFNNPYHLTQDAMGTMMDRTLNTSLVIKHSGALVFTSQTAFQKNYRYYTSPLDGDFSGLDMFSIANDYGKSWNNVKVLTQEFRLQSAAANRLQWTAGAYFFSQLSPVKQATHYGADAGLAGVPVTDASGINISKGNNKGAAIFGQAEYKIVNKFSVIGGLRYDYEHRRLAVRGEFQPDGSDPIETMADTAATTSYNALSPKLALQYRPGQHSSIYLSYSRGFRAGGLTQPSGDPSQPPLYPYQPEYSNNFELGMHSILLNDRLTLSAAAFFTEVQDAQVPSLVLPDAITVTRNTGKLQSKGVEFQVSAKPLKGLQMDYNFGYTHATYKSLKLASNGQSVDLAGNRQIFTPDITSMLALQYNYAFAGKAKLQLFARGEWFYTGSQYFDLANTIYQGSYHRMNARWGIASKFAELSFWVRNMTGEKYIAYAYDFGAIHLADPRTYGCTLRVNFGH